MNGRMINSTFTSLILILEWIYCFEKHLFFLCCFFAVSFLQVYGMPDVIPLRKNSKRNFKTTERVLRMNIKGMTDRKPHILTKWTFTFPYFACRCLFVVVVSREYYSRWNQWSCILLFGMYCILMHNIICRELEGAKSRFERAATKIHALQESKYHSPTTTIRLV